MHNIIKIRGARQHNLKNIDLDIPKNKLVVMTGVSGSGKSSLAFDTIYAEGQRRYVESLSAYARQFLGIMDKPDVDVIEGLSPAISIDQKTASHNPRSTVGTITEIYDYLRLLYARIGHPHCPNCHIEISKLSSDEIVGRMLSSIEKKVNADKIKPISFTLFSPIVRQKKGEFKDLFDNLLSKGYKKIKVDNKEFDLNEDEIDLIKTNKHNISVAIDSFSLGYRDYKQDVFRANLRSRLSTMVEQGLGLSSGLVILHFTDNDEHLFSEKFSCPNCNLSLPEMEPRMFSFNSPIGACPKCRGIGTIFRIDPARVINENLSVNEGGLIPFANLFFHDTWYIRLIKKVSQEEGIDFNKPIKNLDKKSMDKLLYGTNKVYKVPGANRFGSQTTIYEKFSGIINELEKKIFDNTNEEDMNRYMKEEVCDVCHGKRLKPEVLSVTIDKKNISEITDQAVSNLNEYFEKSLQKTINDFETQIAKPILKEIKIRLQFLNNVGLGYLTLSRYAKSLSGGELQRIRLASQIGTGLTGVLYVLDEPSIGLHSKDVSALIKSLQNLKEIGNTLVVVEHDQETIESADYVIELGPKAGRDGGKITFEGTIDEMKKDNKSLTGQYLNGSKAIAPSKKSLVKTRGNLKITGAKQFNLKNISVEFPLGNLIAVTGVSGSGKSSLITNTLYPALRYYRDGHYKENAGDFMRLEGQHYLDRVYMVDQSPIGRTPRSNPATYIGIFDEIREIFATTVEAKAAGFTKSRFSFNLKGGRCEKCSGAGVIKIEMQFLSDVYVTCDLCEGRRYNHETLEIRYKGKSIYDILKMTIDEAVEFFSNHTVIYQKLKLLKNVGLGYVELGQQAPTFSGGEAQRIKLANELSKKDTGKTLYILDEPTTGLHFYDIEKLLHTLKELVDRGNTVVVIEHNMDVIKNCQYIIDLGPDGGDAGGHLVYQGETRGILKEPKSYTGEYLRKVMK